MRIVIATLAAAALTLAACSECEPEKAPQTPGDTATSSAPDGTSAGPPDAHEGKAKEAVKSQPEGPATPSAKQPIARQAGRKIRTSPDKSLKMAPVQKCPSGGCEFRCAPMSRCLFTCDGGDCRQICDGDSSCTATCSGGGCLQQCLGAASCSIRCGGGQCDQQCDANSACSRTCKGGECKVCQGSKCKVKPL